MSISAAQVKELRDRTGAGFMECKKALTETDGDIDLAIENMRKAGQAKADKKSGRIAAEGVVIIQVSEDGKQAVMVEINSETDFVARDESFLHFANQVANTALQQEIKDIESLNISTIAGGSETVETVRQNLVAKLGENLQLRRLVRVQSANVINAYVHSQRIGVLVDLAQGDAAMAKDIAMHIAAAKPLVGNADQVPAEVVEKEKAIFSAQAQASGKPADIIEKMITGRITKFLDEVSLLGQPFVKDPNTKVGQMLKQHNAEVANFIRFEVGDGIEKKQDDFAAEVMAQAGLEAKE